MNAINYLSRGALVLGAVLAATALSVTTASASLAGTVFVQADTIASVGTPSTSFDFNFGNVNTVQKKDGFAVYDPTLGNPTFNPLTLDNIGGNVFQNAADFVINFGSHALTLGGQQGTLVFRVAAHSTFNAFPGSSLPFYFFLDASSTHLGDWEFTVGSTTTKLAASGILSLQRTGFSSDPNSPGLLSLTVTAVPEPSTYISGLGAMGLLGTFFIRRRNTVQS